MNSALHQQVLATIRRHDMFRAGDRVGVGVSGGADSVGLLRLLEELRPKLGITLSVLHFNHQLRGAESDGDDKFVRSLAQSCGMECYTARGNVAGEAKRHGWNREDAGRRMRYEFFSKMVEEGRITKVATAHTADDQAETVLARIIRGSGITGLASIHPQFGHVFRPLLEVRRASVRKYLKVKKQEWREDESNRELRQLRARVRHQLLPLLKRDFSNSIVDKLCDIGHHARENEVLWTFLVDELSGKLASRIPNGLAIRAEDLLSPMEALNSRGAAEPSALRALGQRLVRRLHAAVAESEGQLTKRHVEKVMQFAKTGRSGRHLELPAGVHVEREFDRMIFHAREASGRTNEQHNNSSLRGSYEYAVKLPSTGSATITIPELGRSYHLKVIDWPMRERDTRYENDVLDAEQLSEPVLIRNWRPGDAYRPRGRRQSRKLKRMFAERRVPVAERATWPVLTSDGKVAWAEGMPPAAAFSANEGTRKGVWISVEGQIAAAAAGEGSVAQGAATAHAMARGSIQ